MTTEIKTAAPKKLTITLTDRPPVKITEADWPIIAEGRWDDHDGQIECQANRTWTAWLKVRQHTDGRTLVYGRYCHASDFQNESGADHRDGQMLATGEVAGIVAAIQSVGACLAERSGDAHWDDVIAECIADLPAEELT